MVVTFKAKILLENVGGST